MNLGFITGFDWPSEGFERLRTKNRMFRGEFGQKWGKITYRIEGEILREKGEKQKRNVREDGREF